MPTFEYQSLSGSDAAVIEAPDRAAAVRRLREQGITPVSLKQVERRTRRRGQRAEAPHVAHAAHSGGARAPARMGSGVAMSRGEMASFVRELATAIMAGLPLVQALKTIARQGRTAKQRAMLDHLIGQVEHGKSLGDAAASWGRPFTELTISLIRAGEMSGRLGDVLEQAANLLDRELKLRRTLMAGLLYPGILGVLIVIAVTVIVTVIVPRILAPLQSQFRSVQLPWPTRVVQGATMFVGQYWWLIALVIAGGLFWISNLYRAPASRLAIDRALLRVPVLGKVLRDVAVARFTRTLYTLVSAGLPALTALRATKATLGNRAMEVVVEQVCEQVSSGKTISQPMEASGYFPPLLTQIVGVGERSGRLPQMLGQAAGVFEDRTESSIKTFTTVFPPLLIIIAAVIIGFVVAALMLPLIQAQELLG